MLSLERSPYTQKELRTCAPAMMGQLHRTERRNRENDPSPHERRIPPGGGFSNLEVDSLILPKAMLTDDIHAVILFLVRMLPRRFGLLEPRCRDGLEPYHLYDSLKALIIET
jgi:hypothetical protein